MYPGAVGLPMTDTEALEILLDATETDAPDALPEWESVYRLYGCDPDYE